MSKILKAGSFVSHLKNTKLNKEKYEELYKESIENNDDFWNKIAQRITWKKKIRESKRSKLPRQSINQMVFKRRIKCLL